MMSKTEMSETITEMSKTNTVVSVGDVVVSMVAIAEVRDTGCHGNGSGVDNGGSYSVDKSVTGVSSSDKSMTGVSQTKTMPVQETSIGFWASHSGGYQGKNNKTL